jgi:hypothetical protein
LMTESLFCFFFFLFLILFFKNFNYFFCKHGLNDSTQSFGSLFVAGMCLGIACLIRPVGPYFIILFLIMLLFSDAKLSLRIKRFFVFFFAWLLAVLPWLLRNYLLTGFLFFHTWNGVHFMHYFASPIYMKSHNVNFSQASRQICVHEFRALLEAKEKLAGHKFSEIEKCRLGEQIAFEYIKQEPLFAIRLAFYNMFKTCVALYSSDLLTVLVGYPPACYDNGRSIWNLVERFLCPPVENKLLKILIWFEIFCWCIILIGFVITLFNLIFNFELLCSCLKILPIIGLMILLTLACGFARLRLPIEPFIIIFSLNFWLEFFLKKGDLHGKQF